MSETQGPLDGKLPSLANQRSARDVYLRGLLLLVAAAIAIYFIIRHFNVVGNILLVLFGFGAVVLVHEFGHFLVAKLSGIKVEAFSIFMPPTILGFQRTEKGLRIRILPRFSPGTKKQETEPDEGLLSFTIGRAGQAGETEYRIGLIPLGGFVKMLGQDDTGPVKSTDDPRSFANKSVTTRMAVIAAGVVFNALSAAVAFMVVFLVGIKLPPPVVGGVFPDSPAAHAGIKPGDEVIEINGRSKDLDFGSILVAAVLSGKDEQVRIKVKREGQILDFALEPKLIEATGTGMRSLGIDRPQTLTIAKVSDPNLLLQRTGFLPGDRIVAVNGKKVEQHWELVEIIENSLEPVVTLTAERKQRNGGTKLVQAKIKTAWSCASSYEVDDEAKLHHIFSMVPRLQITAVGGKAVSIKELILGLLGLRKKPAEEGPKLKPGDIILAVGDIENPTYKELREITEQYDGKKLPIRVLRIDPNGAEKTLLVNVRPRRARHSKRVLIGIGVALDTDHPVVAKTVDTKSGPAPLAIPRGAVIRAVNGVAVSNYYDVVKQLLQAPRHKKVIIEFADGLNKGTVSVETDDPRMFINVKAHLAEPVPFEQMKRLYKAGGPIEAVGMGYRKTVTFIARNYITLKRLASGLVSPRSLMGPVGILAISYNVVADQPLINYVYLWALISVCIAVFNFLPLLPFDGGHIVLLLVEKVKGSALSERTQGAIAYAGVLLLVALFLYLTFNDIINIFTG